MTPEKILKALEEKKREEGTIQHEI